MPLRPITTTVRQATSVTHRVSIGLISISLSLMSLALGLTLLTMPLPTSVFVGVPATPQSAMSSATAVTLTWTAPGDDANIGQASSYDLRYSTSPLTANTFAQGTAVAGVPSPQPAGSMETFTVNSLQPSTTYFFGLKTSDESLNTSAISNVVAKTTSSAAAACVPQYQCSDWSACIDGAQNRTCTDVNNCAAGLDQPVTRQTCSSPAPAGGEPVRLTSHWIVVGTAPGTLPVFRIVDPKTLKVKREVLAFARSDRHGVNVAIGDLNGDHQPDIIAASGAGTSPKIKVFTVNGTLVTTFSPYPTSSKSGVAVALGDINADGKDELLTVPASGSSQLRAFTYDAAKKKFSQIAQTFVYNRSQTNGFTVATGDLNLDGRDDVVIAPRTNGRSITVLKLSGSGFTKISQFQPFGRSFRTGLTVAVGDIDGNGRPDILAAAGPGYYSNVKVFNLAGRVFSSFLPTSRSYLGGLTLSTLDVNQDGRDEMLTGTYKSGDPAIRIYRYSGLSHSFTRQSSAMIYAKNVQVGLRLASQ